VLDIVQLLLGSELKGHWQCPCGSGKRLRKCHLQALIELRSKEIPRRLLVRTACVIGASVLKGTDKQVDELRRVAREMRELVGELKAA